MRLTQIRGWLVERTGLVILIVGALMLATYVTAMLAFPRPRGRLVFGDATHHFVQLRSLVFDRDLNFRNEYVRIYGLENGEAPGTDWIFTELTPTGRVRNYMPIGPALLWAPLYLVVTIGTIVLASVGVVPWPDGFGPLFQIVPGVTGVIAATGGAWWSWRLARRYTDAASAAIGTIAVWLGSHAIYYSLISPNYSHTASMLTSAWFFWHWLRWRDAWSVRRLTALGALAGLASLMRWQDAVFLAVPIVEGLRWQAPWRERITASVTAGLAWLVVFSPQMLVWQVLYGRALAVPQGPSFMQWRSPHLIDVLLSTNHGLLTWAPVLIVSLLGLATFARYHRSIALPLAVVCLTAWYVNAAVADWWAGEAFGARRFLSLFPLFVLGAATWLHAGGGPAGTQNRRTIVVAALVVANGLLLVQYELFMKGLTAIAPYPKGWFGMWAARFVVPFRLIAWWWS